MDAPLTFCLQNNSSWLVVLFDIVPVGNNTVTTATQLTKAT